MSPGPSRLFRPRAFGFCAIAAVSGGRMSTLELEFVSIVSQCQAINRAGCRSSAARARVTPNPSLESRTHHRLAALRSLGHCPLPSGQPGAVRSAQTLGLRQPHASERSRVLASSPTRARSEHGAQSYHSVPRLPSADESTKPSLWQARWQPRPDRRPVQFMTRVLRVRLQDADPQGSALENATPRKFAESFILGEAWTSQCRPSAHGASAIAFARARNFS